MAISKTVFRHDSLALQAPEVLAFLQANATDYFDTIEYNSETNTIVCSKDNVVALRLFFTDNIAFTAYLNNGASISGYRGGTTTWQTAYFSRAISTSKGLCIAYINNSLTTTGHINYLFITKDNNGELFFAAHYQSSTGTSAYCRFGTASFSSYVWSDFTGSKGPAEIFGSSSILSYQAAMTTLSPITEKNSSVYAPALYLMTFNQYQGIEGKFLLGTDEYYTNGFIALKG